MFSHRCGSNEPKEVSFREMAATDFGRFHVESLLNKKYQNLRGADATVGLSGIQLIEIF